MASLATLPRRAPRFFVSTICLCFYFVEQETDLIPAILNPLSPDGRGQHPANRDSDHL